MSALSGIRVLDLSRLLPGPFATLALADLGATVDRIEEPGGDYLRHMPPDKDGTSGLFLALNRNKRSACFDLKNAKGREALLRLVARYDVLVEQFRPGVLDRLGLTKEALRKENPKLVICSITGYGKDGPDALRAGHDLNYIARAGLLGFQGGSPPSVPGFQVADIGGALWAVIGILAALREREGTGKGTDVDISMTEAAMGFGIAGLGYLLAGVTPKAGDEALTGGIAPYATYLTMDGRAIALAALEPKFFLGFASVAGLEASMDALIPGAHQVEWKEKIASVFRTKTAEEWQAVARANDFCLEIAAQPDELARDPQHAARKSLFQLDSPWGALLQWKTPTAAADFPHAPPPRAGQHTRAILADAGFSEAETLVLLSEKGAFAEIA